MRLAYRRFLYILRVQFFHPPHPPFPMPPKHRQSRRIRKAIAYSGGSPNPYVDYTVESGAASLIAAGGWIPALPDPSCDMRKYPLFPVVADLPPKSDTAYWRDAPKEWNDFPHGPIFPEKG